MSCFRPDSAGSIPATRSNDVSVRTNRTDDTKSISKMVDFFVCENIPLQYVLRYICLAELPEFC